MTRDGDRRPVERRVRPLLVGMGWFPDQPGGLNRFLRGLLGALRDDGVEARRVVVGPAADGPRHLQARARHRSPALLRAASLRRSGRKAAPDVDVVDAHFALYAVPVSSARGALRRLPLVVHFQGPWADESRGRGERREWVLDVKRGVERAVYRRARQAIVLSAAFKRMLVERYGVSPWHVHVIPPGVDLDRFRPGDRLAAAGSWASTPRRGWP